VVKERVKKRGSKRRGGERREKRIVGETA